MVMGATAVTTAILRTEAIAVTTVMLPTGVIDPGRGRGGYGNGYGGVGRRWPPPYADGYERSGYEEPPRPPAPVWSGGDY